MKVLKLEVVDRWLRSKTVVDQGEGGRSAKSNSTGAVSRGQQQSTMEQKDLKQDPASNVQKTGWTIHSFSWSSLGCDH